MPELNFNLLAPTADLSYEPQVKMDPVAAYEKAKATRQSNMLAQLYAKHYDPQTGGVNYNALIGDAAQTGLAEHIPSIMKEAQTQAKSQADIAKTAAETESAKAEAGVRKQTSLEKKIGNARTAYESIYIPTDAELQTPEGKAAYNKAFNSFLNLHEDIHSDPEFQEMYTAKGGNKDDAYSQIMSTYGNPAAFRQLLMTAQMGTKNTLDALDAQKTQERLAKSEERQAETAAETKRHNIAEEKIAQGRLNLDQTKTAANLTDLPIKEIQKREAALPKAKVALDASNTDIDSLITDLTNLANHPGLNTITGARAGTGIAKGITTVASQDAANAQTLLNKIKAKGTLRSLVDLRNSSPTGGALGNVSDADVRLLTNSFANIDTTQGTPEFKQSINDIIGQLSATKTRLKDAFDDTYSYRSGSTPSAPAASTTQKPAARTVVRTGTANGKKVVQYSDGSVEYAP